MEFKFDLTNMKQYSEQRTGKASKHWGFINLALHRRIYRCNNPVERERRCRQMESCNAKWYEIHGPWEIK